MRGRVLKVAASLSRALPALRGRTRLGLTLYRLLRPTRGTMKIRLKAGPVLVLPMTSSQGWNPAFTGRYDDEEVDLLTDAILPNSMVLDIGACFGLYTIPLAARARLRGARVVAFEPIDGNFRVLVTNVHLNGLSDVATARQIAIGRKRSVETARVERGGTGNAVIIADSDHSLREYGTSSAPVRVEVLDELTNLPDLPCSVVKMDVEGLELDVLAGGKEFFARHRPTILGEFGTDFLRARGIDADAPYLWAASHGYACHELTYSHPRWYSDRRVVQLRRMTGEGRRLGTSLLLRPE